MNVRKILQMVSWTRININGGINEGNGILRDGRTEIATVSFAHFPSYLQYDV